MAKKVQLTAKQRAFIAAYDGNGTEAARKAGYSGGPATLAQQAYRLLRNAEIREAIEKREEGSLAAISLTRSERQELWSQIAVDPGEKTRDRLRALELLAKSQGDFVERLEVKGELTLEALVLGSMKTPEKK